MSPDDVALLTRRIAAARPGDRPRLVGRVTACDGGLIEVGGLPCAIGTRAAVQAERGESLAEVVGFRGARTMLVPLARDSRFGIGAAVRAVDGSSDVACGDALLGRVVDALGMPLDRLGPIAAADRWPLAGRTANVLDRGRVTQPFDCGVRAVNALHTLGRGQRVALIAGSGVGKSVLMGQMIAGADVDRIVIALVGERGREVNDFLAEQLPPEARARSVVVAVPADHPPILRLRAAMRATAIAEAYRARGLNVLLLVDSLTRTAHAQREIGLALGEPPTMKGYPPSALALIPALVERAGVDVASGGSITAIYTVLADGDDLNDPVVDTARAICDGHLVLSRALAEQGIFPALDISRSLSRVMADVAAPAHQQVARHVRRLWSVHAENRDLILMGAYSPGSDPLLDAAVAAKDAIIEFVAQPRGTICALDDAVALLDTCFGGLEA